MPECGCYIDEDEDSLGYTLMMCAPHFQEIEDAAREEAIRQIAQLN